MIVIHDARGGIFLQSDLHDFAGMHRRAINRAAEEIHALNDPVPFVEQDQSKHLIIQVPQAHRQVFTSLLRLLQRGTIMNLLDRGERVALGPIPVLFVREVGFKDWL
jgi:hypothetical protein